MRPEIAFSQRLPAWMRFLLTPFLFIAGVFVVLPVLAIVSLLRHKSSPQVCRLCQQRGVRGAMFSLDHADGVRGRWVCYCDVCQQLHRLHDDGSCSVIPADHSEA